ncbi:EamA family transporter [Synoicihabitans lomoniglobus]|uniref:EamA family transporter n=1 Tax=Synoicihabitans lomoniglobus TaxID=2909285 RepID=A0AAF0I541_9BACT|nr:EamA family transporter [Opitutaceae bacterium LMO-M01]WED67168.1 EamA family transporter [Opitutaceae bacterium LMO-M01]
MPYLIAVSLLWAFSFGMIKVGLSDLDSTAVAMVRLTFALIVFLPFFRPRQTPRVAATRFMAIGAVQFGLMYAFYIAAFRYLQAYEVAMFTIFTPIYVVLFDGALERRLDRRALGAAALALVGAGILKWRSGISDAGLVGFFLMQGSNLCFAVGQIAYQRTRRRWHKLTDAALFGWLYLGAIAAAGIISLAITDWTTFRPSREQWGALVYLGVLASGLGFFGWNVGATKVNAGTLAVFNNLKIPLAVGVALLAFGESADLLRLSLSLALMLIALYLTERQPGSV